MKRAGFLSEPSLDQPRRSKRLAKTNKKNASAVPSVVSISSNEGSSNSTTNNERPLPPVHVSYQDFPQDAIEKVNAMLPILADYMEDAANDSDDSNDTTNHIRQLNYIQMKECIFRICKFALLEQSFLGKDDETRQVQAAAMNTLVYSPTISSNEMKEFLLMETFLRVLIARGNVLPPKSLYLFQQTHDELWQEIDATVGPPQEHDSTTTLQDRFTTFLIMQGERLIELHNSKISLFNYLLRHDFIKLNQMVELIQVQQSIVQLWIHLLQDEPCWNASDRMRMEQLENVHASFLFCKTCLLSTDDLKRLDVKMMLWKLVLYCSYAMDWPSDTLSLEEKEILKRLGTMVRR